MQKQQDLTGEDLQDLRDEKGGGGFRARNLLSGIPEAPLVDLKARKVIPYVLQDYWGIHVSASLMRVLLLHSCCSGDGAAQEQTEL